MSDARPHQSVVTRRASLEESSAPSEGGAEGEGGRRAGAAGEEQALPGGQDSAGVPSVSVGIAEPPAVAQPGQAGDGGSAGPRPGLIKRMWLSVVTLNGSPHQIALGAAVGIFIGISPTFGLQIIMAIVVSTLLKCSRPAAFITVWVTNVFTLVPIYAFCYVVGQWFYPGEGHSLQEAYKRFDGLLREMSRFEFWEFWNQFKEMIRFMGGMFVPLLIGCTLVGGLAAGLTYPLTLWGVYRYRRLRQALRQAHLPQLPGIGRAVGIVKERRSGRRQDGKSEDAPSTNGQPVEDQTAAGSQGHIPPDRH